MNINPEEKEIIEKRRELFIDKYEEIFGVRIELKELSEKTIDPNNVIVYNVWGIKSKWI